MKKVSRYEEKKNREKRAFAVLHCVHYPECLDKAAKRNGRLECHQCEQVSFEADHYRKEVGVEIFSRNDAGEQFITVEKISCPAGVTDADRKGCKQGRKIMEKHGKESVGIAKDPQAIDIEDLSGPKTKEELENKICSQADCGHGGRPQPIENFRLHPMHGTRFKMCNSCYRKALIAGQQRRHKKRVEKEPAQDRKPKPKAKKMKNQSKLHEETYMDFLKTLLDGLPGVLENIKKIAADQERTPEAQVRYFLKTDERIML